jgi:hypothetical protein
VAISACFYGVVNNVNNYMDNNPRVRRLAQLIKLIAVGSLLGAGVVFASQAMGLYPVFSYMAGFSVGATYLTLGMYLTVQRDAARRRVLPPILPAPIPRVLPAPIPPAMIPAVSSFISHSNEQQPLLSQKNNQGSYR